jgi:hypothetical protein
MLLLTALAAGLTLGAWAVLPSLFDDADGARRAVLFTGVASGVIALLAIAPVAILSPLGVTATAYGYFMGAGLRVVATLLAAVVGIKLLQLPVSPLAATLMGTYLPLMMVEVALVASHLWRMQAPALTEAAL